MLRLLRHPSLKLLLCAALTCSTLESESAAFQMGGMESAGGAPPPPPDVTSRGRSYRELIAEFAGKITEFDQNPQTQAVLKKLEQPVTLAFADETPFLDVLKFIRSATQAEKDSGLPIYIDPAALADADIQPSRPVKIDLEGIPLKTTLRLIVKQIGLAYCVKDGLVFISTPEGVVEELREFEAENVPEDKQFLSRPENRIPAAPDAPQAGKPGGGFQ